MGADTVAKPLDVAVIGSGFGGIGMAYYLRRAGIESFVLLEKSDDVGGVWRENTYPGAACDIASHLYSFSFEPHFPWSSRYAAQSEILAYIRHCARKFGLEKHIRFGAAVTQAEFDEARALWVVTLAGGDVVEARYLVSAVGQLHRPALPKIPGRDRFGGRAFHSAHWDHGFDFSGKTVAVIGTGASAVQFVPVIAQQAARLHVFQRSPGWTIPKFDRVFSRFERWLLDTFPFIHTLDRWRIFLVTEAVGYAYEGHRWAQRLLQAFSRLQLFVQVRDPALRRKLTPDYPVGCKRILLSNDWLRALARPNVEVVTDAVTEVTAEGVRTADGTLRRVDAIVYGTGFEATEFLAPMRIVGVGGRELRETWRQGAEAYYGMSVAGFPNFFMLYGPNTNLGSGSIIYMLEAQQQYVVKMLRTLNQHGWRQVDVRPEAQARFVEEVRRRSDETTYTGNCHSWYKTADGRNTNNWIGLQREFRRRTAEPVLADFRLTAGAAPGQDLARY